MSLEFLRQTDEPLFSNILWNRPVNRQAAGRLLIVGGHRSEFSQIQAAYQLAQAAGVGQCTVAMPDALARLVAHLPSTVLLPSNPSGSLARVAQGQLLELGRDHDAILLGLNASDSSDTSVLLENLVENLELPVVLTDDAFSALRFKLPQLVQRDNCLIIADLRQIFKIAGALKVGIVVRPEAGLLNQVEIMRDVAGTGQATYLLCDGHLIAAGPEQIAVTASASVDRWPGAVAGLAASFWLQHPHQRFEALVSAAYVLAQAADSSSASLDQLTAGVSAVLRKY